MRFDRVPVGRERRRIDEDRAPTLSRSSVATPRRARGAPLASDRSVNRPVEAAGAVDAKTARPPLLGKLQNRFPRASTGILALLGRGHFYRVKKGDISKELRHRQHSALDKASHLLEFFVAAALLHPYRKTNQQFLCVLRALCG